MKKVLLIAGGSLALLAGSAYAGGGCIYGHDAKIASAVDADTPKISRIAEETDPELLALLKKQQDEQADTELVTN